MVRGIESAVMTQLWELYGKMISDKSIVQKRPLSIYLNQWIAMKKKFFFNYILFNWDTCKRCQNNQAIFPIVWYQLQPTLGASTSNFIWESKFVVTSYYNSKKYFKFN